MSRVGIVGGGTAGMRAAEEVVRCGGLATVFEPSADPPLPYSSWPGLIRSGSAVRPLESPDLLDADEWIVERTEAKAAGAGFVVDSRGRRNGYDSVIIATGRRFAPVTIQGRQKRGVVILDHPKKYAELGSTDGSVVQNVVVGEGWRGIQVADGICAQDRRVRLIVTHWRDGRPSQNTFSVIEQAASERGISISSGSVSRALGQDSLEAVIAEGNVLPCQSLAIIPKTHPRVVQTDARLGPSGGILVDRTLSSSVGGVIAAGGCAEISSDPLQCGTLDGDAGVSGRLAGANALGRRLALDSVRSVTVTALGLRLTRIGARGRDFAAGAASSRVVSKRWGRYSACTIAFEPTSGWVQGVEEVQEARSSPEVCAASPLEMNLRSLAYAGSSDISLTSDTARLGLRAWSNY